MRFAALVLAVIATSVAALAARPDAARAVNACQLTHGDVSTGNDPGAAGANVTYAAPSTSGDPCGTIVCSPASGSFYPLGVTAVTCTSSTNNGRVRFDVKVNDTQAPTLTVPADITTTTDPDRDGAVVTFTPTASDNAAGVDVGCDHTSGELFRVGRTDVTCTAHDLAGNTASSGFTIAVVDDQAPVFDPIPDLAVIVPAGSRSVAVQYPTPRVHDNVGTTSLKCDPRSGSLFPIGRTTVSCIAKDAAGNSRAASFTVTARRPDTTSPQLTVCGPLRRAGRALRLCVASDERARAAASLTLKAGGRTIRAKAPRGSLRAGRRTLRFKLSRAAARRLRAARHPVRGKLRIALTDASRNRTVVVVPVQVG